MLWRQNGENSPQRLRWRVLPNLEAALVLTSACSQRGAGCGSAGFQNAASGRGLGLTAFQIPWEGWPSTAEADQENCGATRKTKDHSCRKTLTLHFECRSSRKKGTHTSEWWKRASQLWAAGPGAERQHGARGRRQETATILAPETATTPSHRCHCLLGNLSDLGLPKAPQPRASSPGEAWLSLDCGNLGPVSLTSPHTPQQHLLNRSLSLVQMTK